METTPSDGLTFSAREDDMPGQTHVYRPVAEWTGNTGSGYASIFNGLWWWRRNALRIYLRRA
jgi:hypothetical protein